MLVAVLAGSGVALAAKRIEPGARRIEEVLNLIANSIIFFAMLFVSAEVFGRYFIRPIPGHLELSELLLPPIVFLALAHTQALGAHIRMEVVLDLLPAGLRRGLETFTLVLSLWVYVVLCYFSAKHTYVLWEFKDTTSTPPYFLVWPSGLMVTVGLFFTVLRMYLELVHRVLPRLLPTWREEAHQIPFE
jgi:TRAP-type C4-dicarboxylate transport system permease small subunit